MNWKCLNQIVDTNVDRIWRGEDPATHERRVIKELTADAQKERVFCQRLVEEVECLGSLANDCYLAIMEFQESDARIFYADAQCTLEQFIERHGQLENDLVANVLLQVGEALSILHATGRAHGSLNAQKIFVDPQGSVKLADFIAFDFSKGRPIGERHRRMKYQAPENLDSCFGDCGPISDLYNLGYVALEMLAGSEFLGLFGFAGSHLSASPKWLQWHADPHRKLENWRETLPHINRSLCDLIDELIAKPVGSRKIRTAGVLVDRLSLQGLHSTRVLPSYDVVTKDVEAPVLQFCPPSRIVVPVLSLHQKRCEQRPQRFTGRNPVIIGSDDDLSISLKESHVEPRHALLACQRTEWFLYDLRAERGTSLNRAPVSGWAGPLRRGDEIRIADIPLTVDIEHRGTALIPPFDLKRRIHLGSNGELYYAIWNRPTGPRPVALRLPSEEFSQQGDPLRRFLRAISETKKINRPEIVRILKAGLIRRPRNDQWYFATEFMSGRSLRNKLTARNSERMTLYQIRQFAIDISYALLVLEEHRLLHRNINPSCILFTTGRIRGTTTPRYREVAKLGDFLLSRPEVLESFHQITRGQLNLGDFPYQAPELLTESGPASTASDLFSLAACVFEAVVGQLPVPLGTSMTQTVTSFATLEWPTPSSFRPSLKGEWDRVLGRALLRNPARRYQHVQEFLDDLQRLPV